MTPEARPMRHVTFYTKPGCHLCEDAEELLDGLRNAYNLHITSIDITTDLAIYERYKYDIPVIVVQHGHRRLGDDWPTVDLGGDVMHRAACHLHTMAERIGLGV